jgi:hypothetical protein
MAIRTIPLSQLEADLGGTLNNVADSGDALVVALPDQRLVAIHSLDPTEDDSLTSELLETNPAFQSLVAKSKAGSRKTFQPKQQT